MESNNKLSLINQLKDILVKASSEETDRQLCDDANEGEYFCTSDSENLGVTDIYPEDGHNIIHAFNRPYHLSDLSPEERETYIEPGTKPIKKNKLKPTLTPLGSYELGEQDDAAEAGTSSAGEGIGTASMGVWDSGIQRGHANPVGIAKWSDIYGINRGKGNPLW